MKKGAWANIPIDLVWLWFRSPHDELAAMMMRTSEPPHYSTGEATDRRP
jgi:hypothetical protein